MQSPDLDQPVLEVHQVHKVITMLAIQKNESYIDLIDRRVMPFVEYEGYSDRYTAQSALTFEENFYKEIRAASRELFLIFEKTVKIFQKSSEKFLEQMDFPKKLIPFLNIPKVLNLSTWLSRFDFVIDQNDQLKMIEINADTPCGIIEAYYVNEIAAKSLGYENPNFNEQMKLKSFLHDMRQKISPPRISISSGIFNRRKPFIFSCFDDYVEDYATTIYLMKLMKSESMSDDVEFVSFYDLRVDEEGLLLPDGRYAGAIYRLHPIEILIEETATDDTELGVYFMEKYAEKKFAMFNPPEAVIMQNKSFLALVWQVFINGGYFDSFERQVIEKYMLPSYFEEDELNDETYIKKPIWGREGRNISIVNGKNKIIYENKIDSPNEIICRESKKCMYQKFVDSKHFEVLTDSGLKNGMITIGCFMIGDRSSAVYCRFSEERILGNEAYYVPLLIEN